MRQHRHTAYDLFPQKKRLPPRSITQSFISILQKIRVSKKTTVSSTELGDLKMYSTNARLRNNVFKIFFAELRHEV